MRALVKYGLTNGEVEVRDVPEPELRAGTVVVERRMAGVCGSDVHMWRNNQSWSVRTPLVLGHESAGVIAAVASDVTGWHVGDRVVCETAAAICGDCAYCRTGRYNLCPSREGYGAIRDGAFAERFIAEPRVLHRIPDNLPFEVACLTEPFAVAYNALVERTAVNPGDTVVIQGAGAIGVLALQMARLRGAGVTVVLGTSADTHRLELARLLGADHTIDVTASHPMSLIRELGDGLGADVVVDATGVSAALKQGMEMVRPLGSIVKVGWGPEPFSHSLDPLVQKAATLVGSFSHTWSTWERVLGLLSVGKLDAEGVLGGVYALEDWKNAFEEMEVGHNIKSVLTLAG